MKKIIVSILFIFLTALPVSAMEIEDKYTTQMEDMISEYDISFDSIKEDPFGFLWQTIKSEIKKATGLPLDIFYKVTAILIVTTLINFFSSENNTHICKLINIVSVLLVFNETFESFISVANKISASLFDVKNFMTTFIPVFGGISFAAGEFTASAVYTGFFLISIVAAANFCISYIIPSLNLYLAVGVTSQISSAINLKPLCELYSKTVKVLMKAAVSAICFVLSLQTVIAKGNDGLMLKAGRFIVTAAVPVIGSSLEGAVGSIYASMGVLKGFCGLAGIAVIVSVFIPHIAVLLFNWICYQLLIILSGMIENKAAEGILSCFKEIIEIMLSMCVLFMVLLVFSLTVMIKAIGVG